MNQDKAREFFSSYFEGTLESGLKQSLEQKLRSDAQLQAEYAAFARTMEELGQLKYEQIEIPSYLSDRIASRMEQAEQKPKTSLLYLWLPRLSVGAVAAAAIVGAVINLRSGSATVSTGGAIDIANPDPSFIGQGSDVKIHFAPTSPRRISVVEVKTGQAHTYELDRSKSIRNVLHNDNPAVALFQVKIDSGRSTYFVALPGSQVDAKSTGSGSLTDLAVAASGHFHTPVLVAATDTHKTLSWTFEGIDARAAVQKALTDGQTVDIRPQNLLTISDR